MKKSLIALAAMSAFATAASAQSNVSLYGAIGAASTSIETNGINAATNFNGTADDHLGTTALGLKGTEDLGGGLSAFFNLEGDLSGSGQIGGSISSTSTQPTFTGTAATVTGTLNTSAGTSSGSYTPAGSVGTPTITTKQSIFNRQAHVGITSKEFGTISMGRQNDSVQDLQGLGQVYNLSDNLHANSLVGARYAQIYKYATPTFNGLKATYSYSNAPANTTSDTVDGTTTLNSYALQYTGSNFTVGLGQGTIASADSAVADQETTAITGNVKFGNATLGLSYWDNQQGVNKLKQTMASVNYTMGKIDLKAHYVTNDQTGDAMADGSTNAPARYDGKGYGLMGVYNLSKRTSAYAAYADFDATVGTTNDQKVTTIGLIHKF
jgi:predicted porin